MNGNETRDLTMSAEDAAILGKPIKIDKCYCCGKAGGPTVYEKDGVLQYIYGCALIVLDRTADYGLRIWEVWVDKHLTDPIPTEYWIKALRNSHRLYDDDQYPTIQDIVDHLHVPFMS